MGAVVFWTLLGLVGSPPAPEASAGNTGADGKLARDEGVGAAQPA
jgi:hypothetical protein